MRKAAHVRLTLVSAAAAALVASGCGRPAAAPDPEGDPCAPGTLREIECRDAISHRGYYRHGVFVPHVYYRTYNDYAYDDWLQRQQGPASGSAAPAEAAHGVAAAPDEVSRGGFGETGEAAGRAGGGIGE